MNPDCPGYADPDYEPYPVRTDDYDGPDYQGEVLAEEEALKREEQAPAQEMTTAIENEEPRDKKGRKIRAGDLLKTPHFKSGRRWLYLYHVAVERDGVLMMVPTRNMALPDDGGTAPAWCCGRDAEIVQAGDCREFWRQP